MYSQWVSWYLHRALCLAFLCVLILLISSDSSYVCYTLPRDSLEFVVLFLLLHSAGVCLGYQLQLCWSHVYAPLFYILLFFPFFLFFPGLLIALEGLNTTTDLFLFSFSFLPFPLSPLCFESLNCNYRSNPSVLFWLPLQLWHLLFGRWFGVPSNGGALACICTWLVRCACCT